MGLTITTPAPLLEKEGITFSIVRKSFTSLLITLFTLLPGALPGRGSSPASADEPRETLGITGSVRGSWWNAEKKAEKNSGAGSASLWLKSIPQIESDVATLQFEGWVRNDDISRGGKTKGDLTEGYADLSFDSLDVRIGRQMVAWGKADAVNPTDNLVVRDFTLLTPDDANQKSGVAALRGAVNMDELRLTALWLPEFRGNTLPLPTIGGIRFSEELPDNAWGQWGIKLEQFASDYDWSLSYFDGYDRNPDLALKNAGALGIDVALRYGRLKAFGADGALNFGRYGLRAEAAYLETGDTDGKDPFVKNPVFYAVAGGDRTFLENLNVNLQFVYRAVANFTDADSFANPGVSAIAYQEQLANNQMDSAQQGVSFRINNKWLNETLEAEISGLVWLKRGDSLLRPRLKYAVNDALGITIGGDIYQGPATSFFGRLNDATALFTEIRHVF
ncbi:MAG: hypothetical protein HZA04_09630 [Nitrospinae bacterium]|nr:hypothetical protein [Nitrospinota bacterium]